MNVTSDNPKHCSIDPAPCEIYLVCCTQVLLQDIGAAEATRNDVALTYSMAIRSEVAAADKPDWPTINGAILKRWKMSGLEYIKLRAHGILNGTIAV